jgi:putative DNA primase/helicase
MTEARIALVREALTRYGARGWQPVELEHVDPERGICTCIVYDTTRRKTECRSAGKHPQHPRWTTALRSVAFISEFSVQARPLMNIGIATGPVSGIWVLDVDPDHGGDAALRALTDEHGDLPLTWMQRTGSGGAHYAFTMPDDFVPTNSAGRLPDGIDVRGKGGQIVVWPSVSAKGPYEILANVDPAPAPAWLLDLVRPPVFEPRPPRDPNAPVPSDDRLTRYAQGIVDGKCADLRAATSRRNTMGWGKAADLWRLINSDWNPLDPDEIRDAWWAAVKDHPLNVLVRDAEIEGLWTRGRNHAGAETLDPPADRPPTGGEVIDLPALPFASSSTPPPADAVALPEGALLPSPNTPLDAARQVAARLGGRGWRLRRWRGDWYRHVGTHWHLIPEDEVHGQVYLDTEPCWYLKPDARGVPESKPWNPNPRSIHALMHALGTAIVLREAAEPDERVTALTNGVYDLATERLLPHTPDRFNVSSLPYAYDPDAQCPLWLKFLDEQVPAADSRQLLQEFMGYLVSGRRDLEKILHLYGARRAGKGTVVTVLEALMGEHNTAAVTLIGLSKQFGEEDLIGHSLAMVTDASWKHRDVESSVESLKAISGRDPRTVHRKGQKSWRGHLPTRFVIVGNDEPDFHDPSGALLGRLLHIPFNQSVYDREDPTLKDRLVAEMPGIFNWALDGLRSLTARGRFSDTEESREAERDIARSTSPVAGFIEDCLSLMDPACGLSEWLDDLYTAYVDWARRTQGRTHVVEKPVFSKNLRSALSGRVSVSRRKPNAEAPQQQLFFGLVLSRPAPSTRPEVIDLAAPLA